MEIVSNIALISINETLVIQLVSFLLFVFIINRVMFRPIRSAIAERERYLDRLNEEIAAAGRRVTQVGAEIQEADERVRDEAFRIREQMKEEGSRKAAEIFEAARIEMEQEKREAEKNVADQVSEARERLEAESRTLAAALMEKVLERRVAP